jgi:hypothetical protein
MDFFRVDAGPFVDGLVRLSERGITIYQDKP